MRTYYEELYHYGVKGMKWGVINEEEKTSENQNAKQNTTHLDELKSKANLATEKIHTSYDDMSEKWYKSDLRKKLIEEDAKNMYENYKSTNTLDEEIKYTTQWWDEDDGDILLTQGFYEEVLEKSDDKELNESIKKYMKAEKEYTEALKEYNSAVDEYYKDHPELLKSKKELSTGGKIALGTALATIGGLAITSLGLYASNRNVMRTSETVRTGRAVLAEMGFISAAIGFATSARISMSNKSNKKKELPYEKL